MSHFYTEGDKGEDKNLIVRLIAFFSVWITSRKLFTILHSLLPPLIFIF